MDGKNIDKNTRVVDTLALRRTAKEAKRYVVLMRLLKILAIILIAIVAAAYAVSYFYDKYGSFTVKISKYDMINQGLTLSETPDYTTSNSRLNADILYDMTNISGEDQFVSLSRTLKPISRIFSAVLSLVALTFSTVALK